MKLRRNFLPRRLVDVLCFLLIFLATPVVFVFDMVVVLPVFHELGSFFHTFTMIVGLFLIFQVKGNMIAVMMVDTSVDFASVKPPAEDSDDRDEWRECETCMKLAPPRSWHCKACKVCVLKRDHHCLFTGCCIGHRNHRYFMMFVVYLFIGSTYAVVYNSLYLWQVNAAVYWNFMSLLKMTCPLIMLVTGSFWVNFSLLMYNLNLLALLYAVLLLGYHGSIVWHGGVCYERPTYKYNLGWRRNLEIVFGKRMSRVWISPLVRSELTCDGAHWETALREKSD